MLFKSVYDMPEPTFFEIRKKAYEDAIGGFEKQLKDNTTSGAAVPQEANPIKEPIREAWLSCSSKQKKELGVLWNKYTALQKQCWMINIEQAVQAEPTKEALRAEGASELANAVDDLVNNLAELGRHRPDMGEVTPEMIVDEFKADMLKQVIGEAESGGGAIPAVEVIPAAEAERTKNILETILAFVERAKQWIQSTFSSSPTAQYKAEIEDVKKEQGDGRNNLEGSGNKVSKLDTRP